VEGWGFRVFIRRLKNERGGGWVKSEKLRITYKGGTNTGDKKKHRTYGDGKWTKNDDRKAKVAKVM